MQIHARGFPRADSCTEWLSAPPPHVVCRAVSSILPKVSMLTGGVPGSLPFYSTENAHCRPSPPP